jgi:competence protein ComEC
MGDAELEEEADLVKAHPSELRTDLLKVGHHGSRTSSSNGFLMKAAPTTAFISCGVRNRFGHPHRFALDALANVGVRRTDRGGEWRWATDGEASSVSSPYEDDALGRRFALDLRGAPQ